MKKIPTLCLCALLCAGVAAAKDNLAVLPFTGGTEKEGETIAELFSYNRELNEVFSPIPRTTITEALDKEQVFQMGAGMTDPDTIAAIGRQLGARYVVAGNMAALGNRKLLIISIIRIDNLRQIAGDIQTYTRIEEIQNKLPEMARNIIAATRFEPPEVEKLSVLPVRIDGNIDPRVADALAQILSINIIRSGKYLVYPRTGTLEQVRAEHKIQHNGVTADENVVILGKGDNPRFVLSVAARRLGSRNMFNASIINLETGQQIVGDSENYDTLDDGIEVMERLAGKLTGVAAKPVFRFGEWEDSRLYAGLRLGVSPRFYGLSKDISSGSAETGASFEAALQVSVYLFSLFNIEAGLQTELLFSMDTVSYSGTDSGGAFTASFTSSVPEIPLLIKALYRPSGRFAVSLFTGPYFSIPLGKLEYASGDGTDSYNFNVPAGWLVGVAPGIRLGPGALFADIRYGGDFGNTSISDNNGVLSVYSRNIVSFTLGYELGFLRR